MNGVVIGCGAIAPVHADALTALDNANLYGVCDIIAQRADELAEKFGCKAFYDFESVLKDKNVDVVHICTPHYLHYPMTLQALEHGKNVVLEKPAAISQEQYLSLLDKEKNYSARVCAIVQNRENSCVKKMYSIVKNAEDGALRAVFANLRWQRDAAYYQSGSWRGKWDTEGGGLLINQAVHLLDMLCLMGGELESAKCSISNRGIPEIEVEDTADAIIQFKNGVRGVFTATNLYSCNMPFMLELDFDKAVYRYSDGLLMKISDGTAEIIEQDEGGIAIGKSYWGKGHRMAIGKFYNALCCGGDDFVQLNAVRNTMELLFKFYEGR